MAQVHSHQEHTHTHTGHLHLDSGVRKHTQSLHIQQSILLYQERSLKLCVSYSIFPHAFTTGKKNTNKFYRPEICETVREEQAAELFY